MLTGTQQLTSSIHCCPSNSSLKLFLWALYHSRETLALSIKDCTWPIRILGLFSVLASSINATNLATFMLVFVGAWTEEVLVCVVSVMAGLEMISCAYSLVTRTAHSFLSFAVRRSYVFSAWSLECRKAEASEALRASVVSLLKKKKLIKQVALGVNVVPCLLGNVCCMIFWKKILDTFWCVCLIIDIEFCLDILC